MRLPEPADPMRTPAACAGKRKDGSPCGGAVVTGSDKCRMHLGKKSAPVIAEAKARQAVQTYGRKIETTAVEALLDEVKWTAGHVAYLRSKVREIEEHDLVWGTIRVKEGGDDRGTTEEAAPNVWLKLYQAERAHLVKVCSEAIRAGIEERRVKLAEQQGELVAEVIRAILADLDLSAEQQERAPEIAARHLRALSA